MTKQDWSLDMPTHTGRWQKTGLRAQRLAVLQTLVEGFGWTLAPIE